MIPSRPIPLDESDSCYVQGVQVRWTTCTSYGYAMGVHKATLGRLRPSGCDIRKLTGDKVGGTTIPQNAKVVHDEYGIEVEQHVGANVATPAYAAGMLRKGRSVGLQGDGGVTVGTPVRSVYGQVNHYIFLCEGRGWRDDSPYPAEVLVYDPAANGRVAGWGTADQSPSWWPWALVLKFAAHLHPWGDDDPRTLGPGKWYCDIWPDTEPHVHLRFTGSVRTSPFPRRLISTPPSGSAIIERSGPSRKYADVGHVAKGKPFMAYQENPNGQALTARGVTSRLWYGDHDGQRWVHSSGVK